MKLTVKMGGAVFALMLTGLLGAEPAPQELAQATVRVDFTQRAGKVRPMHAVGQPPITGQSFKLFHYLKEAGIPYSRLHDVGGYLGQGMYVDIPNVFPDFDADETKPENYRFEMTDGVIKNLMAQECEPFFRLGVTIENFHKTVVYRIQPPKDFAKWARICEHVIRHYREGWANGFKYDIKYWEIWNEPDGSDKVENNAMWKGTMEQYFEMYDITAKHLRACFGGTIKIGGPASCGFYAWKDPDNKARHPGQWETRTTYFITFAKAFLAYVRDHQSPMDFFSFHTYSDPDEAVNQANYCERLLTEYGYGHVERILNEWNAATWGPKARATPKAAALTLAFMIAQQMKTTTAMLCYYDARIGFSVYGGMFNPDTWEPYKTYYTFQMFNQAYRLGDTVVTECSGAKIDALAATDGKEKVLLLANTSDREVAVKLDLKGATCAGAKIRRIDAVNTYAEETLDSDTIVLPPFGCAEIAIVPANRNSDML